MRWGARSDADRGWCMGEFLRRRPQVWGFASLGLAAGAFSAWYIDGAVWSWPLPLMVVLFVAGALFRARLRERNA